MPMDNYIVYPNKQVLDGATDLTSVEVAGLYTAQDCMEACNQNALSAECLGFFVGVISGVLKCLHYVFFETVPSNMCNATSDIFESASCFLDSSAYLPGSSSRRERECYPHSMDLLSHPL